MATLSVGVGDYMRPFRGPVRVFHAPEAASQTFKKGYPLIAGTASGKENQVKIAGTDPTTGILGIACEDASGVEGTDIAFWMAEPDVEFIGRVQDTGVLAYTSKGTAYGIVLDATNLIWRVDLSDTSNVNCIVTGLVDTVGDLNGNVSFMWKASSRLPWLG